MFFKKGSYSINKNDIKINSRNNSLKYESHLNKKKLRSFLDIGIIFLNREKMFLESDMC